MILSTILIVLLVSGGIAIYRRPSNELKPFDQISTAPLRGILALLIVFHHLGQHSELSIPYIPTFLQSLGMPIVAIFFMLSGYGLCNSLKAKGSSYLNGFLKKRYSKILPIFLILTGGAMIVGLFDTPLSIQVDNFIKDGMTPLPFSWFIYSIIYIYAALFLSAKYGKTLNRTGLLFLGCSLFYMLFIWRVVHWGKWWYITILSTNLGYYIALYEDKIIKVIQRHSLLVYSATAGYIIVTFAIHRQIANLMEMPFSVATIMWVYAFPVAVYLIIRSLGIVKWKFLIWTGAIAMEIYLVHGIWVKSLRPILSQNDPLLYFGVTFLATIPLAWVLQRLSDKISILFKTQSPKNQPPKTILLSENNKPD